VLLGKDKRQFGYAQDPEAARKEKGKMIMGTNKFIYYQEDDLFIGWLEEFPDYWTQGETMDELKENLLDLYRELNSGQIPYVHRVGELTIA
jgi:hypothetical protein